MSNPGSNTDSVGDIIKRFLAVEAEYASDYGELMKRVRDDKDVLYDKAEALDVPKAVFKAAVGAIKSARKMREKFEALDLDHRSIYQSVMDEARAALGDLVGLPLGDAVLKTIEEEHGKSRAAGERDDDGPTPAELAAADVRDTAAAAGDPELGRHLDKTTNERLAAGEGRAAVA